MLQIVVMDDWETWSLIDGVVVCTVTDEQFEILEEGTYPKHLDLEGLEVSWMLKELEKYRRLRVTLLRELGKEFVQKLENGQEDEERDDEVREGED